MCWDDLIGDLLGVVEGGVLVDTLQTVELLVHGGVVGQPKKLG